MRIESRLRLHTIWFETCAGARLLQVITIVRPHFILGLGTCLLDGVAVSVGELPEVLCLLEEALFCFPHCLSLSMDLGNVLAGQFDSLFFLSHVFLVFAFQHLVDFV